MSNHLFLATILLATTKTTKSSSSSYVFLVVIFIFIGVYFLFLRPRSRRMRQQQTTGSTFDVGDEVISAGGILGTVTGIDGDEISVEVGQGQILVFWRRAINLRTAVKGAPQGHTADTVASDEDETYDDDGGTEWVSKAEGDNEDWGDQPAADDSADDEAEDSSADSEPPADEDETALDPATDGDEHHDIAGGTSEGR